MSGDNWAYLVGWSISKAHCRIISRLRIHLLHELFGWKHPLKRMEVIYHQEEGFIFCLTPVALTKSLIYVSNSWLNKEANPVNSKAKHLDYASLNISFKHSAGHIPENSRARLPFKATFIKCKSLFVSTDRKKATFLCDIQDRLKHQRDHLIVWLVLDPSSLADNDCTESCCSLKGEFGSNPQFACSCSAAIPWRPAALCPPHTTPYATLQPQFTPAVLYYGRQRKQQTTVPEISIKTQQTWFKSAFGWTNKASVTVLSCP